MGKKLLKYSSPITAVVAVLAISAMVIIGAYKNGNITAASAEISNWGLSFQKEGEPPVANATAEYLAEYDALYCEKTDEKVLYLTFDAGFENGNMPKILDALKAHNVKATFFLVGNFFEKEPELVKRMVEEGHTVGNHTYSHPDMSAIQSKESFQAELEKNEALYKGITGQDMPKLYRPPQGKFCQSNLVMAQDMGYKTVFWSLAYVDWYQDDQPSKEEAFSKLIPRVHEGAVVLLHSTSSTNAEIMDELLGKWEEQGYVFGDLENYLYGEENPIGNSIFE